MKADAERIGALQQRARDDERRGALRALLATPLIGPGHPALGAVRRHAETLAAWFAREAGWVLQVGRDGARLYKRPGDLADPTRGLPGYDRRRYVLLCLAAAVLERAEAQITLRLLGERLLEQAAEPALAERGFAFRLQTASERRELVAVCRTLLALGVLQRVAGDEDAFVLAAGEAADALYDVQRPRLAGLLAAVRGPSTFAAGEEPATLDERLAALVAEPVAEGEDAHRTVLRHRLARRLLDDPVVYADELDDETRAYFANQRGPLAARLCEATGLVAEQRAEGLALVDEDATLSDVAMPAEGTDAHATLLVAGALAARLRAGETGVLPAADVEALLAAARDVHGRYWRKSAREPGAERELAATAIERLAQLRLVVREAAGGVRPRPAIARFAPAAAELRAAPPPRATRDLFET